MFEFIVKNRGSDREKTYSYKTIIGARGRAEKLIGTSGLTIDAAGSVCNNFGRSIVPVEPLTIADLFPTLGNAAVEERKK